MSPRPLGRLAHPSSVPTRLASQRALPTRVASSGVARRQLPSPRPPHAPTFLPPSSASVWQGSTRCSAWVLSLIALHRKGSSFSRTRPTESPKRLVWTDNYSGNAAQNPAELDGLGARSILRVRSARGGGDGARGAVLASTRDNRLHARRQVGTHSLRKSSREWGLQPRNARGGERSCACIYAM